MYHFPRALVVDLTGDSDYFASTFREVVEHVCEMAFSKGRRQRYAKTALEVLLDLAKKAPFPFVDGAWINDLLKKVAWRKVDDEGFVVLLKLSTFRKMGGAGTDSEKTAGHDYGHVKRNEADPGGIVTLGNPTPEYALLEQVLRNVDICGAQADGWEDDTVYGCLIALKDLPGLRLCDPKPEFIRTLSKAMEKRETEGKTRRDKPFRVREAAYGVVFGVRDRWFRSTDLHPILEAVDFPRKLHGVVIGTLRSGHQHSFLEMIEILSEDRYWHPYLRKAMDIWLPFHHEGPPQALRTL